MEILLKRLHRTNNSTIGEISIGGKFECYSLEDVEREDGVKVYGETAIPKGRYQVIVSMSSRFKKELPLLLNVPNFAGIRIHTGNTDEDSQGCILTGRTRSIDFVGESKLAFARLFPKIKDALTKEKVYITIE